MSNNQPRFSPAPLALAAALVLVAAGTGCKQEGIRAYQVPKEQARAQASPHGAPAPSAPKAHVHWESLPPNWRDRPVSGVMRAAEFAIQGAAGKSAELAVFALPEVRGMELEFVNMWREQISLAAATTADIENLRETVTIAGNPGQLYDMAGEPAAEADTARQRIVVALYSTEGTTWFFKLTGPDALVASEKENLKTFLAKVELHVDADAGADPHAGLASASTVPPTTASSPGLPQWVIPANWSQTPPGRMLLASFDLPGGAKVTVSSLGGDGGGLLPNVNRWRGQLGLTPITEAQLPEAIRQVDTSAGPATMVDLASNDRRMLTVIVPHQGQSWYYKLLGDTGPVAEAREAFLQFAQSAQY